MGKEVAILTPSFMKPDLCKKHVESMQETAPEADIFVHVWKYDPQLPDYVRLMGNMIYTSDVREYGPALNKLWSVRPGYKYYVLGSDDMFGEIGWLKDLIQHASEDGFSILWPDDQLQPPHRPAKKIARFPFISGKVADALGYLALPGLGHYFIDDVWTRLSDGIGRYGYVSTSRIVHRWVSNVNHDQWSLDQEIYNNWSYNEDLLKLNKAIHQSSLEPKPVKNVHEMFRAMKQEEDDVARARKLNLKLTVVCPTAGRSTLETAVNSVIHQLNPGDEIIVVGDRKPDIDSPYLRYIHYSSGGLIPGTQRSTNAPEGGSHDPGGLTAGMAEREIGQAVARGDYILQVDDDDIWLNGAIDMVRTKLVQRDPHEWHLFRMQYGCKQQWTCKQFEGQENGEIILPALIHHNWRNMCYGCQWIVMPNREWLPRWRIFKGTKDWNMPTDWTYIHRYMANTNYEPIYHPEVVGIIRPTMEQIKANLPEAMWPKTLIYAPQPHGQGYKGWNGDPMEPLK